MPVVATAVGGTPEVIEDGQTGYLVPPGDAAALAGRMLEAISDPAGRSRLTGQGRGCVATRFSFNCASRKLPGPVSSALGRSAAGHQCGGPGRGGRRGPRRIVMPTIRSRVAGLPLTRRTYHGLLKCACRSGLPTIWHVLTGRQHAILTFHRCAPPGSLPTRSTRARAYRSSCSGLYWHTRESISTASRCGNW